MTKFRSLMYREWRVSRKTNIIKALFLILFTAMMWGMVLSVMTDSSIAEGEKEFLSVDYFVFCVSCFSIGMGIPTGDENFKSDLNSGWLRYSYSLPITIYDRISARMVRTAISTVIGFVFSIINIAVCCSVADTPFSMSYIIIHFCVLVFTLAISIIFDFFTLSARSIEEQKTKSEQGGIIIFIIVVAASLLLMKINKISFKDFIAEDSLSFSFIHSLKADMLIWLIPLIPILIAVHIWVIYCRLSSAEGASHNISVSKSSANNAKTVISDTHDYPKGFLYKEIRQNRIGILLIVLAPLFSYIFASGMLALICFFDDAEDGYIDTITSNVTLLASAIIGACIATGILTGIFKGDDKKLWGYFTASTSAGIKGFLYTKYVLLFAMNGIYLAASYFMSISVSTVRYFLVGEENISTMNIHTVVFFALLFLSALDIPFIVRFGTKKGSIIKISGLIVFVILLTLAIAYIPPETLDSIFAFCEKFIKNKAEGWIQLIPAAAPFLSLGVYYLSYRISCGLFMKGVNAYDK